MTSAEALEGRLSVAGRGPEVPAGGAIWLLLLYTASGLTALAYEVLWVRMLSLQFGVSIFGVVVTVTAFMAGLGTGSLMGLRLIRWVRSPLRLFAALEAAVAVYALLLPVGLGRMDELITHAAAAAGVREWYLMQCTAALLLLFAPACAMGAGLPLILKTGEDTSAGIGRLYGLNTLGGVLGALLPLWLLPDLGWSAALRVVAAVGMCVAAGAVVLSLYRPPSAARDDTPRPNAASIRPGSVTLLAYAGIGAAALALEIAWTRLFGMILLRTEYVMAVILAVFLLGIAMGSLLIRRTAGGRWLNVFPPAAALFSLVSLWALPAVSRWAERTDFSSLTTALLWQGGAIALVTLPVTLILGAWLPLLSQRSGEPIGAAPWLYGANALGGALGALGTGFIVIPWLGTPGTLCAAAGLLFICGMAWGTTRWIWVAAAVVVVAAYPVWYMPPVHVLLPLAHGGSHDLYVHEDAVSITHVVQQRDGQRVLLSDLQRMDASTDPSAVALQMDQARLPLLLHPAARSVLFLGLGTGISAAGSLPFSSIHTRTAVELSRGAIAAAPRWFAAVNDRVTQRTRVVWDDARHFLVSGDGAYDVIIGDVFHPDMVGRSSLLSVQQFQRVKARLSPGGIFVQWLALNQFDPASLQAVMRSFRRVFPRAVGFIDGFRFALVGPQGTLNPVAAVLGHTHDADEQTRQRITGGEGPWTWLGRYWGAITVPPGPVQDEWAPYIEFRLPQARYRNDLDTATVLAMLLKDRPGVEQAEAALGVTGDEKESFERGYLATELGSRSWLANLEGDEGAAQRLLRLAYEGNPADRWIGFSLADQMLATLTQAQAHGLTRRQALQTILNIRPDHVGALRAMWRLEEQAGNHRQARMYRERIQAISPLDKAIQPAAGGG
jgi:spermidine synthase